MIISICIPTYNREQYLLALLNSIEKAVAFSGLFDCIEVCVSDNASTDDTVRQLNEFMERSKLSVNYVVQLENVGPDRNYLECTKNAAGEYIWFLGSDDLVSENSLVEIFYALKYEPALVIFERYNCDNCMNVQSVKRWVDASQHLGVFDTSVPGQLESYLKASSSLGAIFSYLSCIVVRRVCWDASKTNFGLVGSGYIHADKLLKVLFDNVVLTYISAPLVLSRGGNDSFAKKDLLARIALDYDFYFWGHGDDLVGESRATLIRGILKDEWPFKEVFIRYNLSDDIFLKQRLYPKLKVNYGAFKCWILLNPLFSGALCILKSVKHALR
mgnify:CR=1 FL=1